MELVLFSIQFLAGLEKQDDLASIAIYSSYSPSNTNYNYIYNYCSELSTIEFLKNGNIVPEVNWSVAYQSISSSVDSYSQQFSINSK